MAEDVATELLVDVLKAAIVKSLVVEKTVAISLKEMPIVGTVAEERRIYNSLVCYGL